MIQQEYKNNVQAVNGNIATTGFTIEVNESMFQMLTSNVYNDTTLAVMREWSTNACDACLAADKEVKFDVHLPTIEETYFSVRDYGTGLAPEDIVGLFSNLGASTKRNSNLFNGTLGIGRMAGLAVSEAFTVESYFNGTLHSYVISMQNGVPVTMKLGESATTEPNGLKLSVNVDMSDIEKYHNRVKRLYQYFDYKPTLNLDISVENPKTSHMANDWYIKDTLNYNTRGVNYIVMSQVAYEIPYSSDLNTYGFKDLIIKASPGSVTFNPGRESLSLNKSTIEYLNKAFARIKDEYIESANMALTLADSDFQLMEIYTKLVDAAPSAIGEQINPEPFCSGYYKNLMTCRWGGTDTFSYLAVKHNFNNSVNYTLNISHKGKYYRTSRPLTKPHELHYKNFFTSNHVIVDVKSKFKTALSSHFSDKELIIWHRANKEDIDTAVSHAKEYLEGMGIPYVLASSIIDEIGVDEPKTKVARNGLYASVITGAVITQGLQIADDKIEDREYLYVKLKNTTPVLSDSSLSFDDYMTIYYMLNNIEAMPPIRGVAKKYQECVDNLDNWVDFEDYIKDRIKSSVFVKAPQVENPYMQKFHNELITASNCHKYPKDIQDYYNEVCSYNTFHSGPSYLYSEPYADLLEQFGASFIEYTPTKQINMDTLLAKYPKTMELIRKAYYDSYNLNEDLSIYLAKLEEHYALHSTT